jgi:enoyl-CoA hydratase/carnithine racemase
MVLSSKRFNAEDALRMGLIDELVPQENLNKTVKDTIKRILYSSPDALALVKRYSDKLTDNKIVDAVNFAQRQLTELLNVEANVNTIKAFTEGEKAPWAVSYKPAKK